MARLWGTPTPQAPTVLLDGPLQGVYKLRVPLYVLLEKLQAVLSRYLPPMHPPGERVAPRALAQPPPPNSVPNVHVVLLVVARQVHHFDLCHYSSLSVLFDNIIVIDKPALRPSASGAGAVHISVCS